MCDLDSQDQSDKNSKNISLKIFFSSFNSFKTNKVTESKIKLDDNKLCFKKKLVFIIKVMKTQFKRWTFMVLILATILTAFQQSNLTIRKTSFPLKIFPSDKSFIDDYEFGSLSLLSKNISKNEISFVMYYAPWDAETIRFKNEFELIAKHFSNQIYFASINCWWPEGECRKAHVVKKYPFLNAIVKDVCEIQYTGPLVANYIIAFLDNILHSLTPILKDSDLEDLRSTYDLVVVGYFVFENSFHSFEYDQFFIASIKSLYNDPWQRVKFAVVSNSKVGFKLGFQILNSFSLYSWNSTLIFQNIFKNSDELLARVYENKDHGNLITWVTPSGSKSDILSSLLTRQNILILFTPRNLLFGKGSYFDFMREVAMDYNNCDNSQLIRSYIHKSVLSRKVYKKKLIELEEKCHEIFETNQTNFLASLIQKDICCHSKIIKWKPYSRIYAKQCYCTACLQIVSNNIFSSKKFDCLESTSKYLNNFDPLEINQSANFCNEIKTNFTPSFNSNLKMFVSCSGNLPSTKNSRSISNEEKEKESNFLNSIQFSETSQHESKDEIKENMKNYLQKVACSKLYLGLNYSDFDFPASAPELSLDQEVAKKFTGLGCSTNKTLVFIAIDSILFPNFAQSLGINILEETHSTTIFIIESKKENIYLLNHELASKLSNSSTINKQSVYKFIINYNQNNLNSYFKSSLSSDFSSYTCSEGKVLNSNDWYQVCIEDLKSLNFKQVVLSNSKDVIVMYYTNWCGFCASVAHIYLSVSQLFQGINEVQFTRINADMNDLTFEYTVEKYPTIIIFPSNRKSESATFNCDAPISESSLIQFILQHVQRSVRWKIYLNLCNKSCLIRNSLLFNKKMAQAYRSLNHFVNNYHLFQFELETAKLSQQSLFKTYLLNLFELIILKKKVINFNFFLKSILKKKLLDFDNKKEEKMFKNVFDKTYDSESSKAQKTELKVMKSNNFKQKLKLLTKDEL